MAQTVARSGLDNWPVLMKKSCERKQKERNSEAPLLIEITATTAS